VSRVAVDRNWKCESNLLDGRWRINLLFIIIIIIIIIIFLSQRELLL